MMENTQPSTLQSVTDAMNRMVRPISAYLFAMGILYFTYTGYLTPDAFLGIAALVIGFFFRGRDDEKREERMVHEQGRLLAAVEEVIPQAREEARKVVATEVQEQERRGLR